MKVQDLKPGDRFAAKFGYDVRLWDVVQTSPELVFVKSGGIREIWNDADLQQRRAIQIAAVRTHDGFWTPIAKAFHFWFGGAPTHTGPK